jgi:predicted nucleic acid-binding OB-fold protein
VVELREAQKQDVELLFVLDWVRRKADPKNSVQFRASPAAKSYWLNKEQFHLLDYVLYQNDPQHEDVRLVMPKSLKWEAISLNHGLPSSGHQGVKRTKEKVKEKYAWYELGQDVKQFISQCEACNQNKKGVRQGKCPITEYQAGSPIERVH